MKEKLKIKLLRMNELILLYNSQGTVSKHKDMSCEFGFSLGSIGDNKHSLCIPSSVNRREWLLGHNEFCLWVTLY